MAVIVALGKTPRVVLGYYGSNADDHVQTIWGRGLMKRMKAVIWAALRKRGIVALAMPSAALIGPSPGNAATCTIPNAIANGQTADAGKVMADFNALASCVSAGVTATGTPTTGAISVFSGTGAVTSGNLTGDVTTSGSTVTSLSATGVVAGTYSNATVQVDAKGRVTSAANGTAGTGTASWWFQPPQASQFAAASFDATLPAISNDANLGMMVSTPAPGGTSNDEYRLAYKTLPAGNWQVTTRLSLSVAGINYQGGGLVAYESSTGKVLSIINFYSSPLVTAMRIGTLSAYGGNLVGWQASDTTFWARLSYDSAAGTYSGYFSSDGKTWSLMTTVAKASVFTGTADRVGIAIFNSQGGGSGIPVAVSASYWQQSW